MSTIRIISLFLIFLFKQWVISVPVASQSSFNIVEGPTYVPRLNNLEDMNKTGILALQDAILIQENDALIFAHPTSNVSVQDSFHQAKRSTVRIGERSKAILEGYMDEGSYLGCKIYDESRVRSIHENCFSADFVDISLLGNIYLGIETRTILGEDSELYVEGQLQLLSNSNLILDDKSELKLSAPDAQLSCHRQSKMHLHQRAVVDLNGIITLFSNAKLVLGNNSILTMSNGAQIDVFNYAELHIENSGNVTLGSRARLFLNPKMYNVGTIKCHIKNIHLESNVNHDLYDYCKNNIDKCSCVKFS